MSRTSSGNRCIPFTLQSAVRSRTFAGGLALLCFVALTATTWAGVLTDLFNTNVNYLTNGVVGTIWDGVYFGAGEFANTATGGNGLGSTLQCDANLSTNNMLSIQSTATGWENAEDDGFFLFKVMPGDFSAVVHVVTPYNKGSFNTSGLQVRAFNPGGGALGGSEDYLSLTRFDQFGYNNYLRNTINGATTQIDTDQSPHNGSRVVPSNNKYWLRIDRVNGTTFNFYERGLASDPWTPITNSPTLVRADLAGLALQVGIIHATFNVQRGVQFTDCSIMATNFDTLAAPPPPVTGLTVTNATNSAGISWLPDAASSGSLVVVSSGRGPIKQVPANGFTYTGNAAYGLGDQLLASNYFVVHSGTNTSVTVSNLPAATSFNVAVYDFAGAGPATAYSVPVTGSFTTPAPSAPASTNVVVDPPGAAVTNYVTLGDWNTDGNFEGWTTAQTPDAAVSNGIVFGTAGGSDPQLLLLNFAGGPDLDLAFFDYIEIRMQLPAGFAGNVPVYFGTTFTPGISGARIFTIPNGSIPPDGAFHVYRLFIGPQVFWRSNLRDLRIDPLGSAATPGQPYAIDYIRVGDLPGDVYLPRYSVNNPAPGGMDTANNQTVMDMSSKHFRILWDNWSVTNFPTYWNSNTAHGTLRNLEEVWKNHIWHLGYREPTQSWTPANRNGNKYKVNLTTFYGGYFAGGDAGNFGWLNITPDGLVVDPPTWVPPHEFMHVCQMHQNLNGQQGMDGPWWEGHANYGRERWIYYFKDILGSVSGIDANYIHSGHMMLAHGRDYYLSWPFFVYLDENPDGLPDLGEGTVAHLWQTNTAGVSLYTTLDQQTAVTPLKDIVGYFARRELTFDYQNQSAITNELNKAQWNPTVWRRFQLVELVRRADDTNWWRVPMEMAPMQGAYATHELIPQGSGAGRVVTVNFHGLPDSARGADWRASFVVISDTGVERYNPLWNGGTNSVTLAANENRLYLVVAGTPNPFLFTGHDDLTYPYRSHQSKQRLHYEVQMTGATPRESVTGSTSGMTQHANGGGWRAAGAVVDLTAYLGPNTRVYNTAQVRGNARVEDYAVISNAAQVLNNAVVSGQALVMNNAVIKENAKVRDWAVVSGSAAVADHGRALDHAQVTGGLVTNYGVAKGCAILWSGGLVGDFGVIEGDFMAARNVTNGFAFGHLPYTGVPDNWVRVAPNRQYADYEFAAANDSMARDQIGVNDAYLVGGPTWRANDAGRAGVLAFNGVNQYVVLDKSLSDTPEISVTTWVRWAGGASNQPAWHFGSATNKCMFFTPSDGTGHAKFVIRNGGPDQALIAPAELATGVWTHVVVTLSNNNTGRLYVNGVLQQQGTITITPDQLNAANTGTATPHHYLAHGADGSQPYFSGSLDSLMIYTRALTGAEISGMVPANQAPSLAFISNQVVNAGVTLAFTNSASDPDQPWQTLAFNLPTAPSNSAIDASSGLFSWRPAVALANTTNSVTVRVADNGSPVLAATRMFSVTIPPLAAPAINAAFLTNGQFGLQISGDAGPDYSIQSSTNLADWVTVFTTNSPALPFGWVDPNPALSPVQFYRVMLGP